MTIEQLINLSLQNLMTIEQTALVRQWLIQTYEIISLVKIMNNNIWIWVVIAVKRKYRKTRKYDKINKQAGAELCQINSLEGMLHTTLAGF